MTPFFHFQLKRDNIAGAILTVCFNKPAPVVDSNIARFMNRFYGLNLKGEIRRKKEIVQHAEELFNHNNPGRLLFAIVDFTSLICKPQKPDCNSCPLKLQCRFYKGLSPNKRVSGSAPLRPNPLTRTSDTRRPLGRIQKNRTKVLK